MFSTKLTKNFLLTVTAISMLSSCSSFNSDRGQAHWSWFDTASNEANLATVAYSQGKFSEAEEHINLALRHNPDHPQALMVGAMLYEQIGRPNRARQYYEDLIVLNGDDTTILGSPTGKQEKMSEIAQKRLRMINVKQSQLVVEEKNGTKVFNLAQNSAGQSKSTIAEAIFLSTPKNTENNTSVAEDRIKSAEVIFDDTEQNMISRFLILKELAEKDLVTKEEFLNARMSNIGALLPLTNKTPAYGIDRKVPSPDLIIERIAVLKDAVETRAITPREFSAERNLIIEALLPPAPRQHMSRKPFSKDIMHAAQDLRKLEVLYDLDLITADEKLKEQKAIEKQLGININPPHEPQSNLAVKSAEATAEIVAPAPIGNLSSNKDNSEVSVANTQAVEAQPTPLLPPVSSPFK